MKFDIDNILNRVYDGLESGGKKVSEKITSAKVVNRYKEASDPFEQFLGDVSDLLTRSYDAVSHTAEPVIQKTGSGLQKAARVPYRKAGMPYGDTEEGYLRWKHEYEESLKAQASLTGTKVLGTLKESGKKVKTYAETKIRAQRENNDREN